MEALITTGDLQENNEFSSLQQQQQQHSSLNVKTLHSSSLLSSAAAAADKQGGDEIMLLDTEHTVVIIFQTILLIILCIFGTLTNSLVFWVFNRRPALRSLSNRFVLSLVTANIIISSIIAPLQLFSSILHNYFRWSCIPQIISMISSSVIFSAIFSTFLIATDRFYAVTSPLHYSMTITRSRSQIMIVLAWLSGILLAAPYILICNLPLQLHQSLYVIFIIIQLSLAYLFPFFGLCWLYMRMYHAAHRNSERTRKHSISGELLTVMDGSTSIIPPQGIDFLTHYINPFNKNQMTGATNTTTVPEISIPLTTTTTIGTNKDPTTISSNNNTNPIIVPPPLVKKQRRRSSSGSSSSLLFREEGRAIKTALLVLASFLLCWSPHFASILISEIQVPPFLKQQGNINITTPESPIQTPLKGESNWVRFFGVFGILLSCLLNPFIYVFRNKMACKEVSKLLCTFFREKRRLKEDAEARERHQHLLHHHQHKDDDTSGPPILHDDHQHHSHIQCHDHEDEEIEQQQPQYPRFNPTVGKSPKRSSLKSLTPQSSLSSCAITSHGNNANNVNVPTTIIPMMTNNSSKPPFMRSMTVPEQTQPRVKFPPNLIRQKSCIHRPLQNNELTLTPALRSKFVRQDSICSILSNDSVLMICADDGLSMSESGLLNRPRYGIGIVGACSASTSSSAGGECSGGSSGGGGGSSNITSGRATPLQRHYLRQDSNFSDKTNDSGIVVSSKQDSPCGIRKSTPCSPNTFPTCTPRRSNKGAPHHHDPSRRQSHSPVLQTSI